MPRFEFGPLYKFFTSAGLVLIIAAIALPWAILRESSVLLISQQEMDGLTPVAQAVIETKQVQSEGLVHFYPWLSGALLAAGVFLLVYGLIKWSKRQKVVDEKEDNEVLLQRRGLEPLNSDEIDHRRNIEVAESIAAEQEATSEAGSTVDVDKAPASERDTAAGPHSSISTEPVANLMTMSATRSSDVLRHLETRSTYTAVERQLLNKLSAAFSPTHDVAHGVKMSARSDVTADLVALSPENSSEPDYVFELKYFAGAVLIALVLKALSQIRAMTNSMTPANDPTAVVGVAIVVVEEPEAFARLCRLLPEIQRVPARAGPRSGVLPILRSELASLEPRMLRRAVIASLPE
ncbi:hypothetical protein [Cellulomonas xiejunii]|uniref:hypothetical protein n=1 Tax=Cellulomonas xiejunii TaxID=2968083 RepID=UPI001D0E4BD5|nr:hypothetical protein [Cellulomonas xiejunii]MCC2313476.1 hypothetical protein [Cellulomonas xiejunii]